jgi:DNA-binding winged helix-turn-helix (wHTH) protein
MAIDAELSRLDLSVGGELGAISFGPFRLVPIEKLLLHDGRPVRLGSRALDVLIALAERPGDVVSNDELMACVWPDTHVDESSLRVHIASLRKALGDGQPGNRYIANIPGRGYSFVASISGAQQPAVVAAVQLPAVVAPEVSNTASTHNLPASLTRMIGRANMVAALGNQLPERRFVTIVGPGGIGKTTVALAAATTFRGRYRHGVWFVDLAPVAEGSRVPSRPLQLI